LTPESTPSGNAEADTDGSLDLSSLQTGHLRETTMDESASEDLSFDLPVCESQLLSGQTYFPQDNR